MDVDRCICCGAQIPEGRQVCWSCEHMTHQTNKSPSDKQIELADAIANTLNIDFPLSSKDFTAKIYWEFINDNIDKVKRIWFDDGEYGDGPSYYDELNWFTPLNQN